MVFDAFSLSNSVSLLPEVKSLDNPQRIITRVAGEQSNI